MEFPICRTPMPVNKDYKIPKCPERLCRNDAIRKSIENYVELFNNGSQEYEITYKRFSKTQRRRYRKVLSNNNSIKIGFLKAVFIKKVGYHAVEVYFAFGVVHKKNFVLHNRKHDINNEYFKTLINYYKCLNRLWFPFKFTKKSNKYYDIIIKLH